MYFDLAVDNVGSWRYNSNIFIQVIETTRNKLVQKDYSSSFTSRSLCSLLFCKDAEELINNLRPKTKSKKRNHLLWHDWQYATRFQRRNYPTQRKLLYCLTVKDFLFRNIDNLIGRAAHISFINNIEMIRTLVLSGPHYFFWFYVYIWVPKPISIFLKLICFLYTF